MKRIKIIVSFVSFFFLSLSAYGQTFEEMKKVYPISINEGQRVITGFQPFINISDEQILANAMKWFIKEFCKEARKDMYDVDVNKKTFSLDLMFEHSEGDKLKYVFICQLNIKIADGKLIYTVYDVGYKTPTLLSLSSVSSLSKLNPEKKQKHKEIISTFQELVSKELNCMFDAVIENKCATITHWNDINIQRPVKGMNEDECFLAFGNPNSKYEDSQGRTQWSYGLNFVLIFKEGHLETIIR